MMKNLVLKAAVFCLLTLSIGLYIRLESVKKSVEADQKYSHSRDSIILEEAKMISRKVDEKGIEHVTFKDVVPRKIKDVKDLPVAGFIDTTAKALNIKNHQIKELTQVRSSLLAENLKLKKALDSNKREVYYYRDKYLSIAYTPHKPTTEADTAHGSIDFKYDAELNIVRYNKRSWFLAPKKSYIDVFSSDPRVTIGGLKTMKIEDTHKDNTGFTLQATSLYNFKDKSFGVGPGISLDLKKFNFQGKYLMDLSINEKTWVASGSYSILKL